MAIRKTETIGMLKITRINTLQQNRTMTGMIMMVIDMMIIARF